MKRLCLAAFLWSVMSAIVMAQPPGQVRRCDTTAMEATITALQAQVAELQAQVEALNPPEEPVPDPTHPAGETSVATAGELVAALKDCPTRLQTPIRLRPGTYKGNFMAACQGTTVLGVTTLADGQRVVPADVSGIVVENGNNLDPTLTVRASGSLFRGFTIKAPRPDRETVLVGDHFATTAEAQPDNVVFNQVFVVSVPSELTGEGLQGGLRGFSVHSRKFTLKNSHIAGFWYRGRDSQGIVGNNGPGPYIIENNHIEGSGENVIFGGDRVRIQGSVPTGIIRGNTLYKPQEWRNYKGSVKNLLEFKNARGFLVENNILDGNWTDAQEGSAILLTPRNQYGDCPWCVVDDIILRNNIVRNAPDAFCVNILGHDYTHPSQQTRRVTIEGNLFRDCRSGMRVVRGVTEELAIIRNTWPHTRWNWLLFGDTPKTGTLRVEGNVIVSGEYGLQGGQGASALPNWVTNVFWSGNVVERTAVRWINWPAGTELLAPGALTPKLDPETFKYLPGGAGYGSQ